MQDCAHPHLIVKRVNDRKLKSGFIMFLRYLAVGSVIDQRMRYIRFLQERRRKQTVSCNSLEKGGGTSHYVNGNYQRHTGLRLW